MYLFVSEEYICTVILIFPCRRKGDYYRYLAEFKGTDDRKEAGDQSLKAYEVCLVWLLLLKLLPVLHFSPPFMFHYSYTLQSGFPLMLQAATSTAASDLPPTHPIRLGLALNFSVFYYEILNSPERLTCISLSLSLISRL